MTSVEADTHAAPLPTMTAGSWTVTALLDSLRHTAAKDAHGVDACLFFYGVTEGGWRAIRDRLIAWRKRRRSRTLRAYIGTDHALTEPQAVRLMLADGVDVRLMQDYTGVYHPKVVWLSGPRTQSIWIGSNNLTRDGMLRNIEFGALLQFRTPPVLLKRWAAEVHRGSVACSESLLRDYELERKRYGEKRVALGSFVWGRREKRRGRAATPATKAQRGPSRSRARRGDLIVEIMPRETGQDGKQIQLPMSAATSFFGLPQRIGSSREISIRPAWTASARLLRMTIFKNRTVRLTIRELEYDDRPGVLLFRREHRGRFTFDIVSRSVNPVAYRQSITKCAEMTRRGSRRWAII